MDVKSIVRSLIEEKLSEVTELDHSRYMRSHGKKAIGNGNWMFTSKGIGAPKDDVMEEVITEQFNTEKGEAKEYNGKKYIGLNLMWNGEKFGEVYPHSAISQTKRSGSKIATSQKSVVRWGFRLPGIERARYAMKTGYSSRDEAAQTALRLYKKNMEESLDEASNSKLDKALSIINARITKPGQPPKYPSFDSAPEDIKAAARNLAKNMK